MHRIVFILKLKNKSEVIQLHQETQKLYEILSVLRFYEENFEALQILKQFCEYTNIHPN